MFELYRLSWEMVKRDRLHKYLDADPMFHSGARPAEGTNVEQVDEGDWERVSREDTKAQIEDQRKGLEKLISEGELIRNITVDMAVISKPRWNYVSGWVAPDKAPKGEDPQAAFDEHRIPPPDAAPAGDMFGNDH